MKQHLRDLANESRPIIKLAHKITWTLAQGRGTLTLLDLSRHEKAWLKEHGFEYTYNRKISEYEINLD